MADADEDLLNDLNADRLREECGVFGIYGHPDAAAITALGLHALQHRGQEACGIVTFDGRQFHSERRLGLVGDTAVRDSYQHVLASVGKAHPDAAVHGVLVQSMAPPGREIILGITRDPTFGPMLMIGLGGIHVEVLRDVAFAPVPIERDEALALIGELRSAALLDGVRGAPPADRAALAELMVALSRFAADHADLIEEIDLNPVIVHPRGQRVTVVDALIVKRRS